MTAYWFLIIVAISSNGTTSTSLTPMPNEAVCTQVLRATGELMARAKAPSGPQAMCRSFSDASPAKQ